MADIKIRIDARQLVTWSRKAAGKLPSALASGLNKSAREGRTTATQSLASDANVTTAIIRRGIGPLNRASPGKLIATWDAKTTAIGILNTRGSGDRAGKSAFTLAGAKRAARKGLTMAFSTFSTTGGGSAHLQLKKAFVLQAGGGRALMVRTGKAKKDIKSVYAASAASIMRQPNSAPRVQWTKIVTRSLPANLSAAVQRILNGGTADTGN